MRSPMKMRTPRAPKASCENQPSLQRTGRAAHSSRTLAWVGLFQGAVWPYALGTGTIPSVRSDSLRNLLLLPSSTLVHDSHPQTSFRGRARAPGASASSFASTTDYPGMTDFGEVRSRWLGRAGLVVLAWPCWLGRVVIPTSYLETRKSTSTSTADRVCAVRVRIVGPCGAWVRSLTWWHG